ncbi:MAG: hypothetical protein JNM07_06135 [Phycisphaerae bacterium]|nr:hypothetical protein [Phycisphaerae bacterium]
MATHAYLLLALLAAILLGAGSLHALARLGAPGRALADQLARAPLLDLVVFFFTIAPAITAGAVWRLRDDRGVLDLFSALGVSIFAQALSLVIWSRLHELAHPEARRGPRIVSTLNTRVGRARNHIAVWWTAMAVPIFTAVRLGELIVYPPLTWLVRLPRYRSRDWVNVSRQKFTGLVGYDLIWCLYCDWMTGVWSLGSEMLRNVESFWCPIRFASPEKCENCSIDFPDVGNGWVDASGSIADVASLIGAKYPGPGGVNSWYGHPARLTIEGKPRAKAQD